MTSWWASPDGEHRKRTGHLPGMKWPEYQEWLPSLPRPLPSAVVGRAYPDPIPQSRRAGELANCPCTLPGQCSGAGLMVKAKMRQLRGCEQESRLPTAALALVAPSSWLDSTVELVLKAWEPKSWPCLLPMVELGVLARTLLESLP